MSLIVEDGFSTFHKTGIGQYTDSINNIIKFYNYTVIQINKSFLYKIKKRFIRRFFYNIWLNSVFLLNLFILNKDSIVIFTNYAVPIFKLKKVRYIPVIHDLYAFNCIKPENKLINLYEKNNVKNAIQNANRIITVSKTIKKELIKYFNINENKIFVVYNTIGTHFLNRTFNFQIYKKYNIQKQKYILSVATLNRRKNIPELIKAFESITDKYPDIKLVLVGGMGNEKRELLTKHPNVIFTGYIHDEDLPSLYKNALLYVFPSLYEGFGIPLIEAQYSNCPVLCSDIPVFQEVAGNGAEFCTPDSNGIAAKLEYLINNEQRRLELISLGQENVKRFSIENIAQQLKEVIL